MRSIALRMSNAGAAGPADPSSPLIPSASSPPALDVAAAEKLIGAWKRVQVVFKPIEKKLEAARKKVSAILVAGGIKPGTSFASKHGNISLQTKDTIDWEAMARSVVKPEFIEQLIKQFTKTSAPFVRAPASWSAE